MSDFSRPDLPGNVERDLGNGITLTYMAPEASDTLELAMARWREFRAQMTREPADEVYSFAYWLLRWSGLVVPSPLPSGAQDRPK